MKNKIKYIPQHDSSDCGAAILATITHAIGEPLSIYDARRILEIDQGGSSLVNMCNILNNFKINYEIYEIESVDNLKSQDCLILCIVDQSLESVQSGLDHYHLVYKTNNKFAMIIDPNIGKIKLELTSYFPIIKKTALFISKYQDPVVLSEIKKENKTLPEKISKKLLLSNINIVFYLTILSIVITLLDLMPSIMIGKIVDSLSQNKHDFTVKLILYLALSYFSLYLLKTISNIFRNSFSQKMDFSLSSKLLAKILSIPFELFANRSQGDYINRFNSVQILERFLSTEIPNFVISILSLLVFSFYLFSEHYLFGFLAIILFLIMSLTTFLSSNYFKSKYFRIERSLTEKFNLMANLLYNLKELTTASRVDHYFSHWEKMGRKILKLSLETSIQSSIFSNSNVFVANIMSVIILYIGFLKVNSQEISIGEFVTIFSIFRSFISPVTEISDFITQFQNLKISEGRLNDILTEKSLAFENNTLSEINSISLNNVTLNYREKTIIQNLSFELKKGEIFGLSGPSGCGKTTLLHAILGLKEPNSGNILYNSKPLNFYTKGSINQRIGYVSQYPRLFTGSLLFNLTLRNKLSEIDTEWLDHICKIMRVDEIISSHSQGYFKFINDTGEGLSGGQKQRIAIARALYPKVDFLLLDEPTSSLDQELENSIINNLVELKKHIGIIFSSHRISHFGHVDRCLVFDKDYSHKIQSCKEIYRPATYILEDI